MGFGGFNIFNRAPQETPQEEQPLSLQELHVFNTVQREIMHHYEKDHGVAHDDIEAHRKSNAEWVKKYSDQFGELHKELVKENPHLVEEWLEHPEEVSKYIEREVKIRLYHEDSSSGAEQVA